jgi:hypothetical protein
MIDRNKLTLVQQFIDLLRISPALVPRSVADEFNNLQRKKVTAELKLTKLHLLGYLRHTLDYITDEVSPMNNFYAVNNKTHQYRKSIPLFLSKYIWN